MADCVLNNGVREFPTGLVYILVSGFNQTLKSKKNYLGGKSKVINPTGKIEVLAKSDLEYAIFTDWYINELDYGNNDFTIEAPFFGLTRRWNVKIVGDVSASNSSQFVRKVQLNLEILDDVATILANSDYCK